MKLNLKKIANIKNKKELMQFKLNKPIYENNYLFHYLILFDKLEILKLYKFPIYKENNENLNGILLAAKTRNIKILKYLLTKYPEYVYNKNINEQMFINLIKPNYIIKLLKLKLNWNLLLNYKINKNTSETIYDYLLFKSTYNELIKLFEIYKFKQSLNYLILNKNLNEKEILHLLKMFDTSQYNIRDSDDYNLIFPVLINSFENILKYLFSTNLIIDYYTIINTVHPLRMAFTNKNIKIYSLVWNYIKKNYDYETTDKNLNNIAHFLLKNNATDNVSLEILNNCPSIVWHQLNINKITPLELITKYNFDKYKYLLENKEINLKNIIIKDEKWLKFLNKLKKLNINDDNLVFENYKYTHANLFQSKFKDLTVIIMYLKEKYVNLYLPNLDDYALKNLNLIDNLGVYWPDNLLANNPIFPWFVCYDNNENYWIHSNLNNLINAQRRIKKYDFSFCYLSLNIENVGLHANILIYDFNNMTVERFDPYGDTVHFDKKLDEVLEEELTWDTGLKYIKPSNYLPVTSFQTISDELNELNQKPGDFGGYCLAWCTWYLEHRIKNKNISSKILITKLLKKISELDISFMDYIRNYANKLNEERIKIYLSAGVDYKDVSNIIFNSRTNYMLNEFIINTFMLYNNNKT